MTALLIFTYRLRVLVDLSKIKITLCLLAIPRLIPTISRAFGLVLPCGNDLPVIENSY